MSKPLGCLLQLVGLVLVLAGGAAFNAATGEGIMQITIGLVLAIGAGIGIRKRYKNG